jgi:hypothetical protein
MNLTKGNEFGQVVAGNQVMGQPTRATGRVSASDPAGSAYGSERSWLGTGWVAEDGSADLRQARMWAAMRSEVVHRLVGMNVRHALHAWHERRGRPVAPWAVAFLYAHPSGTVYDGVTLHTVVAGCRMVDDDPELPGAAHLLHRLVAVGNSRHRDAQGWFDPLTMCTTRDPTPIAAGYVGVGLSILGNHATPWDRLRRGDTDDIPGHCYALLTNHSALLLTRARRSDLSRVAVHSTGNLSYQHEITGRRWVPHADVSSMPESDLDVWDQLNDLHRLAGDQYPVPALYPDGSSGRRP